MSSNIKANRQKYNQLKSQIGTKALKQVARESGIEKPAHLGRHVVAQLALHQEFAEIEFEARQLIESLGLSLAEKGNLKSVFDADGEYVCHAHAWGDLIRKLQAWRSICQEQQVEEQPQPTSAEQQEVETRLTIFNKHQSKMVYLLNNWQPTNMAIRLVDNGDNNCSAMSKNVLVWLADGSQKVIGKIEASVFVSAWAGRFWNMQLNSEDDFESAIKIMLSRADVKLSQLANKEFDSVQYLGF